MHAPCRCHRAKFVAIARCMNAIQPKISLKKNHFKIISNQIKEIKRIQHL